MSSDTNKKMQPHELGNLRGLAADIGQQDVKLGLVLDTLILHLAHAHGLDPAEEDAKAEAAAKDEEEQRAHAEEKHAAHEEKHAAAPEKAAPSEKGKP